MQFKETQRLIESETDFTEEGVEKIRTVISVWLGLAEDVNNKFSTTKEQVIVINLNTQTGVEMDAQRDTEIAAFVANYSL
jgi:hypothetical protein